MNQTSKRRRWLSACVAGALFGAATILATATATAGTTACAICGKNLIKNPGAEAGLGIMAVDASGAVPGWTKSRASSAQPRTRSRTVGSRRDPTDPKNRGKNYFFGGTTRAAVEAQATIGKQTIKLPAAATGKTATLSGWLGNYVKNTAQVRAQFEDAAGKLLSAVRIGPDTTIAGTNMTARSRSAKVPVGAKQVTVVVTFAGGGANYKLAGADALSLILH